MSLSPAVLDAMLAAGCTADQIVATVKAAMVAEQQADEARKAAKREGNAERQQRFRDRRKDRKETRNNNNALRPVTPPIDNTHTPCDISPSGENHKVPAFPKPDWADASVWGDFLANRKRKRLPNTATAHKAFLADVAKHSDAEWPPGRLLEHATAKGWGAIYDPRPNSKPNGTADGKPAHSNDQAPRNPYVRAVIAGQAARAADERRQPGGWTEHGEAAF